MNINNIIIEEYGKILGTGTSGIAYLTDDNKVYKITDSPYEFIMAKKILKYNENLIALPKIYEVGKTEDNKYFIIKEFYKELPTTFLNKLNNNDNQKLISEFLSNKSNSKEIENIFGSKFLSFLNNLINELLIINLKPESFDVENMQNNIGLDDNNNFVLFDF
jgi:hypothetical protein